MSDSEQKKKRKNFIIKIFLVLLIIIMTLSIEVDFVDYPHISSFNIPSPKTTFSPGLKAGIPMYGQPPHLKASPK